MALIEVVLIPFRSSALAYAGLSAVHILCIGILLGAIVALDLGLLGLRRLAWARAVAGELQGLAGFGLAGALLTGALLFGVKPADYLGNPAFLAKMVLVVAALANILVARSTAPGEAPGRRAAAFSLVLWLGALCAGRWIAFA